MSVSATQTRSELKTITSHASTVLVGQLAVMGYAVADSIIAGRFSANALAAFSVGTAIYASVFVALMGVMQSLMPIYAEAHGAQTHREVGVAWRQSLYLTGALTALGTVFLLFPEPLLRVAQVPTALLPDVKAYLGVQALALLPALLFRGFSTLSQAIGQPRFVTWIQIASLPTKVALSWWFVFGGAGLAPMGAVGCAWASLCIIVLMLSAAVLLLFTQAAYRPLHLFARFDPPNAKRLIELTRMGVPGGLAMLFEVTSFTLMAVLVARLGVVASAAHQIAANTAAVLFMAPLSISIATSARVSFWIGAGKPAKAQSVIGLGFALAIGYAALAGVTLLVASDAIAALYSPLPDVVALGSALLIWVAAYQAADAVQTVCVFVLRCYRVTIAPFIVYAIALWGLGLGGGVLLTYRGLLAWPAMQSPHGFWIAAVASLNLTAAIFGLLLWVTLRRASRV